MGVAPTGQIFKGFTFDGESSKDYGIYITGSAVYNAPVRDVEMISIPGRNGSFALDRGRFENIEVTYPAGIYAETESDFAQGISDFRNFLASRQGYVELSDDYNLGEYRLAVYKSGLDVSPEQLRAGEFEITFECKPQRFLTSGETEETIANGGTITNPTLFDARPLLEVWGTGTIEFGGQSVTVYGTAPIGTVVLKPSNTTTSQYNYFESGLLNNGDSFRQETCTITDYFILTDTSHGVVTDATLLGYAGTLNPPASASVNFTDYGYSITVQTPTKNYVKGTSLPGYTTVSHRLTYEDGTTATNTYTVYLNYSGTNYIQFYSSFSLDTGWDSDGTVATRTYGIIAGTSSVLTAGTPAYIDLDIGEAYKDSGGGVYVSLNNTVEIGGDLPVLPPGVTTFTIPNTVTQFKVIPRWWKV